MDATIDMQALQDSCIDAANVRLQLYQAQSRIRELENQINTLQNNHPHDNQ